MTVFYTSDQHWNHNNVLKFENRPYKTVEEMNKGMIKNWNNVVGESDLVHHLGDFCFGNYSKWVAILEQLNGKIILYKGNHDDSKVVKRLLRDGYLEDLHMVGDYFKVKSPKTGVNYQLTLSHYPMEIGNRPRKFNIHGHLHSEETLSNYKNQLNVGVDSPINFSKPFGRPISEDELINYLDHINPQIEELFQKERSING